MDVKLDEVRRLLGHDHGLGVVSVVRRDGTISSSVVNLGLIEHPVTGATTVAFVVRGSSYKRRRLRIDPRVNVTVRVGWEWQAIEGPADLIGPLDPHPSERIDVPGLLRAVFRAAGGDHDDWDEYDRVMSDEQRIAVFVTPARVYGNVGI